MLFADLLPVLLSLLWIALICKDIAFCAVLLIAAFPGSAAAMPILVLLAKYKFRDSMPILPMAKSRLSCSALLDSAKVLLIAAVDLLPGLISFCLSPGDGQGRKARQFVINTA